MNRISEIATKDKRIVVGLSSGTSADGVDGALVEISGEGERPRAEIIFSETYPYPDDVRRAVLRVVEEKVRTADICTLNYLLGHVFAEACLTLMERSNLDLEDVDAVGSHGQTVCHLPPSVDNAQGGTPCTLQLGEPSIIAERTGSVVVYDFRSADMAAGGEGAPLAPCLDQILHRGETVPRGFLNIGGIANLSVLPSNSRWEQVIGFDTGPGNLLIDQLARMLYTVDYDRDGELSKNGEPRRDLIEVLLDNDFFAKAPPKSAGRQTFGAEYARKIIHLARRREVDKKDLLATAVMLTAQSVYDSYREFAAKRCEIKELYVSGGGARNRTLIRFLEELFSPISVYTIDKLGISPTAKEALLFAVLADQAIAGVPSSLPQVTGAAHRVVLGKIIG